MDKTFVKPEVSLMQAMLDATIKLSSIIGPSKTSEDDAGTAFQEVERLLARAIREGDKEVLIYVEEYFTLLQSSYQELTQPPRTDLRKDPKFILGRMQALTTISFISASVLETAENG